MSPHADSVPSHRPLLSQDAFQNDQTQKLFDLIDKLRGLGISREVELPELVIVGDQSAGKSSLLRGLTDIPFPLATSVHPFRDRVCVSIEGDAFSKSLSQDSGKQTRYQEFTRARHVLTAEEFGIVMDEAAELMGVKVTRDSPAMTDAPSVRKTALKDFSTDVLKIQISGPERTSFSIVDVPGVFHTPTDGMSKNEKVLVTKMVSRYMQASRSVIVCVASASNDLANQAAFDIATKVDGEGVRTVGVITKCDLVQDVHSVIELASNRVKAFNHGWFVVRNYTDFEHVPEFSPRRDMEMEFFSTGPWVNLPDSRRGTPALKTYLATLLCERIQQSLPLLLEEIDKKKASVVAELKLLGTGRKTLKQKRSYLLKLAESFNFKANQLLNGGYESAVTDEMKLRMFIREANDVFALNMRQKGQCVAFVELSADASKKKTSNNSEFAPQAPVSVEDLDEACSTFRVKFEAFKEPDSQVPWFTNRYQNICSMPAYRPYSNEELRLGDYLQGEQSDDDSPESYDSDSFESRDNDSSELRPTSYETPLRNSRVIASDRRAPSGSSGNVKSPRPESAKPSTRPVESGRKSQKHARNRDHSAKKSSNANAISYSGRLSRDPGNDDASEEDRPRAPRQSRPVRTDGTSKYNALTESIGVPKDIYRWIKDAMAMNRGTELPETLNPSILPALFRRLVDPWWDLTEAHVEVISEVTLSALHALLESVCDDQLVQQRIEDVIGQASGRALCRCRAIIANLQDKIVNMPLQTNDDVFGRKLRRARLLRFQTALRRYQKLPIACASKDDRSLMIYMHDIEPLFRELHHSNTQNVEDEIHDILKAYYELERTKFVENVNTLGIEDYLRSEDGPVLFFKPVYVSGLEAEMIEHLAAEDPAVVERRKELEQTRDSLDHARALFDEGIRT